jgi:IS30 family transposase
MLRCYSQLTLADRRRLHSRPIMDRTITAFSSLPSEARQSSTSDRGTEFAMFRALDAGIGARSCSVTNQLARDLDE